MAHRKQLFNSCLKGLPDENRRIQILEIHTAKIKEHKLLAPDVDLTDLSSQTKNFTGAEIEGLVRAAQSTAMNRFIQVWGKRYTHSNFLLIGTHTNRQITWWNFWISCFYSCAVIWSKTQFASDRNFHCDLLVTSWLVRCVTLSFRAFRLVTAENQFWDWPWSRWKDCHQTRGFLPCFRIWYQTGKVSQTF